MKTIKQLKKYTNSLQSIILLNNCENNIPEVGKFLTRFLHTDRNSSLIIKVEKDYFETTNCKYFIDKKGNIYTKETIIEWIGLAKDYSNLKELQEKYIANGGKFYDCLLVTIIPGITKERKCKIVHSDCRITNTDLTYTDPSF